MADFFGRVYSDVIRNPDLPPTAKAIYAYLSVLCGANNECFPSVATITTELQITEGTFRKYLRILVVAGVVSVKQSTDKRGCFCHNVYTLNTPSCKKAATENNHDGKQDKTVNGNVTKPSTENLSGKDNGGIKRYKEKGSKKSFHNYEERPDNDYAEIQRQLLLKSYRGKSEV